MFPFDDVISVDFKVKLFIVSLAINAFEFFLAD